VGPHLDVDSQPHGLPGLNPARHLGDFGSIKATSYDAGMLLHRSNFFFVLFSFFFFFFF
jgi:hypothetical protein